jgi:tetratricopeptide (TPR) repeat protein
MPIIDSTTARKTIGFVLAIGCAISIGPPAKAYDAASIIEEMKDLARQSERSPLEAAPLLEWIAVLEHEIGRDDDSRRTFAECREAIVGALASNAPQDAQARTAGGQQRDDERAGASIARAANGYHLVEAAAFLLEAKSKIFPQEIRADSELLKAAALAYHGNQSLYISKTVSRILLDAQETQTAKLLAESDIGADTGSDPTGKTAAEAHAVLAIADTRLGDGVAADQAISWIESFIRPGNKRAILSDGHSSDLVADLLPRTLLAMGHEDETQGRHQEAISQFEAALAMANRNNPVAGHSTEVQTDIYGEIALAFAEAGDVTTPVAMLEHLQQSSNLSEVVPPRDRASFNDQYTDRFIPWILKVALSIDHHNDRQAAIRLVRLAETRAKGPSGRSDIAAAFAQLGQPIESERAFARAKEEAATPALYPQYLYAMMTISRSLDRAGDRSGARMALREAADTISRAGDDDPRLNQLALLASAQAMVEDAEGMAITFHHMQQVTPNPTIRQQLAFAQVGALGVDPEAAIAFARRPELAAYGGVVDRIFLLSAAALTKRGEDHEALATVRAIGNPMVRIQGLHHIAELHAGIPSKLLPGGFTYNTYLLPEVLP